MRIKRSKLWPNMPHSFALPAAKFGQLNLYLNCWHFAGKRHALLILLAWLSKMLYLLLGQEGADGAGVLKTQLALDALTAATLSCTLGRQKQRQLTTMTRQPTLYTWGATEFRVQRTTGCRDAETVACNFCLIWHSFKIVFFLALQVKLRAQLGQQIIFFIISYTKGIQFDNRSCLQCLRNVVHKASLLVIIKVRISFSTVQELLDGLK